MQNNFKDITELRIYKNSKLSGTLKRTPQGSEFTFTPVFLEDKKEDSFSYCIKKSSTPIITMGDNLPPFFAGLLPEGRRLNSVVRKLKTSEDDLFSIFAALGSECIGDIDTGDTIPGTIKKVPKLSDVDFYNLFEEITSVENSYLEEHSLAGVQDKISASMISFPLNVAKKNKSYILKLNPADKKNLIQNELHSLMLAKKCGFNVANARIVTDMNHNSGLLVERFDRSETQKLHQEDACQFLNLYPADKYRVSINQIADALKKITNAPQLEILGLLQQYVFSYLLCNGDMHAKNISLQTLEDGTTTLTPLYDLISTAIYGDYKMALQIDGRDDNIKRKGILDFGERYGISVKAMNSSLDKILAKFTKNYELLFAIEMEGKKKVLLKNMITKRLQDLA